MSKKEFDLVGNFALSYTLREAAKFVGVAAELVRDAREMAKEQKRPITLLKDLASRSRNVMKTARALEVLSVEIKNGLKRHGRRPRKREKR